MPKKNITYLLGAGASANQIPIVKKFDKGVLGLIEALEFHTKSFFGYIKNNETAKSYQDVSLEFITDLREFLNNIGNHESIDTYAKKLFIRNEIDKYEKTKLLITLIFFYFESNKKQKEKRYDTFFASILLSSHNKFIANFNIISWNYDTQFEIAYSNYSMNENYDFNKQILNVVNSTNSLSNNLYDIPFNLFKINGSATLSDKNNNDITPIVNKCISKLSEEELLKIILEYYYEHSKYPETIYSKIKYAWENESNSKWDLLIEKAIEVVKKSDYLICIGYSFPFFNRNIDSKLLNAFSRNPSMYKEFHIQDFEPERIKQIVESHEFIEKIQSHKMTREDEPFYLPRGI
ncbi:MAG: hypothetical protein J0L83_03885 [Chitinophagales bacterium]|nr:hypothetical protein [Chitinophagales bacterium]